MRVAKKAKNDKTKVIVLCSGGFDSVVLMHHVREMLGYNEEIYALFFDYGQRNVAMERECSKKVALKLKAKWKSIKLPMFNWTSGEFYANENGGESPYLEYRNLIFLSYAFSIAQSLGAIEIYTGLYRMLDGNYFLDGSPSFLSAMNCIDPNIQVISPFMGGIKLSLIPLAKYFGITKNDFFSCDSPVNGKPCGKCSDCKNIEEIYREVLKS